LRSGSFPDPGFSGGEHEEGYLPIHECSYWSLETAGWIVEADGGTLLLSAPDDSALLRIDTVGAWAPTWHELRAEAKRRAPARTVVEETDCGPFSGFRFEGLDKDRDYWREWMLTLGETHLLVSYYCAEGLRDRDRVLVDQLLASLEDRRA
jgi:hypothetical protein